MTIIFPVFAQPIQLFPNLAACFWEGIANPPKLQEIQLNKKYEHEF
jgi:hypothetical protein